MTHRMGDEAVELDGEEHIGGLGLRVGAERVVRVTWKVGSSHRMSEKRWAPDVTLTTQAPWATRSARCSRRVSWE